MPYKTVLTSVDRWRVQNCDTVTVKVSEIDIRITQQVKSTCAASDSMACIRQALPAMTEPEPSCVCCSRVYWMQRVQE